MSSSHQAATNPSLKTAFLVQKIGDRPPLPSQSYRLLDILEALHEGKEVFFRYIWTVGDLMTTEIKSLTLDHKVADGLAFLEENAVRHIPILDEEVDDKGGDSPPRRELIGIVSQRDLIRIVPPHVGTLLEGETDAKRLKEPLSVAITRNVRTAIPSTPVLEAVRVMVDQHFDCLPVVSESDDKQLVGMLTSEDVLKCFQMMEMLRKVRDVKSKAARLVDFSRGDITAPPTELLVESMIGHASDVMQPQVSTVMPEDSVRQALQLMQKNRFRHLPVLDGRGQLQGMLSDRDILRHLPPVERDRQKANVTQKFRDELFRIDPNDPETTRSLNEKVAIVMTGSPTTVEPTTSVAEVAEVFRRGRFCAVPVATKSAEGCKVVGIVTVTDILCAFLALGRLVGSAMQHG